MVKRCFLCMSQMNEQTGLCTNPKCIRSQPLPTPKAAKYGAEPDEKEEKQEE